MVAVELDEAEQRIVKFLAQQRHGSNRSAGVSNGRVGPQSDDDTDLNGVGAEFAFCKLFNIYPDLSISPRKGGHDAIWAGRTVDVKTTRYATGKLIALPSKQVDPSDVYALMVGTFPVYRFAGFASGAELLMASNLTDLGHGPTYALTQEALLRFET